jgi:hypothetical protein
MIEGWQEDDYLILFGEDESRRASTRYRIETLLPGFEVIGLRSWDDFIVRDAEGSTFTVPTVPCQRSELAPFRRPDDGTPLVHDERIAGKIKWYVTPVVFGGDPGVGENLIWVTHDQHPQLVGWWNEQYRRRRAGDGG